MTRMGCSSPVANRGFQKACWICGAEESATREHLVKASDLKALFGKLHQTLRDRSITARLRYAPDCGIGAASPYLLSPAIRATHTDPGFTMYTPHITFCNSMPRVRMVGPPPASAGQEFGCGEVQSRRSSAPCRASKA